MTYAKSEQFAGKLFTPSHTITTRNLSVSLLWPERVPGPGDERFAVAIVPRRHGLEHIELSAAPRMSRVPDVQEKLDGQLLAMGSMH